LKGYFREGELNVKYWDGGYLFAASKEWRIKTMAQFNKARDVEEKHFSDILEEFIEWFRDKGISMGAKAEESLRSRMSGHLTVEIALLSYKAYPLLNGKAFSDAVSAGNPGVSRSWVR